MGRTIALTAWRDPVATAVLRAKLEGRVEVLAALGRRVAVACADIGVEAVVPVPTDRHRARRRGADHTAALARAAAQHLRVPLVPALRCGVRIPDRGAAVGEDRRQPLPGGAFVAAPSAARLHGVQVLLVDDVLTTGATAAAAATAMRRVQPAGIALGVVARAGHHELFP